MFELHPTEQPNRFRLCVTDDLAVGPPRHVFMFGGVGHAAAINAMKLATGRELIWSTAQFTSFARCGANLDIDVEIKVSGHNTTQASVVASSAGDVVLTALGALGDRQGQPSHQWPIMPEILAPDACVNAPIWPRQGGGLNRRLDLRLVPGGVGTGPRGGTLEATGKLLVWARTVEDCPVDAAVLAIFADLVPAGVASAFGRIGGGNSLDNTLRILGLVPTRWVLCEITIAAAKRGFAHGDIRMFAEDGTLLAVGSQSLVLRFLAD